MIRLLYPVFLLEVYWDISSEDVYYTRNHISSKHLHMQ